MPRLTRNVKKLTSLMGNYPGVGTLMEIDGNYAKLQIGNSPVLLKHVPIIGSTTNLMEGQEVNLSWEPRPGSFGLKPVILGANSDELSYLYGNSQVVVDNITIEDGSLGLSVKAGGIGLQHLGFVPAMANHVHDDILSSSGWQVDDSGTLFSGSTFLHPSGQITLGISPDIIKLDSQHGTYRLWAGSTDPASAPFSISKAGAIAATSGVIAGWTIATTGLTSSDNKAGLISGPYPAVRLGDATAYITGTGIWLGKHTDTTYRMHIGNPAADHMKWDGTNLTITGLFIGGSNITYTQADTFTINYDKTDTTVGLVIDRTTGGSVSLLWDGTDLTINKSTKYTDAVTITKTSTQLTLAYSPSYTATFAVDAAGTLLCGATNNITIAPTGDVVFNPTGNDVYPSANYDLNLGLLSKKWLSLHAAELWVETLVAQETIATIGGRILVGPTTSLTSDLSGTSLYASYNPGFETAGGGGADVFASWTENATGGTITRDGTVYHTGSYSCKLVKSTTGQPQVTNYITLQAGSRYYVQFWTRGDGTYAGEYCVYDSTTSAYIVSWTTTGVTAATWTLVTLSFTVASSPGGAHSAGVGFRTTNSNSTVYFDTVSMYDATVYVKHNQWRVGDIVYMEANGKLEFMEVQGWPSGSGPFIYNMNRNLDGTGVNEWYAGDAIFNTGPTGGGFLDIYSLNSAGSLGIEYAFIDDGGAFSSNQIDYPNWTLFPDVAVVNDAVYFGVSETTWSNVFFYLVTAGVHTATFAYEYYNGSTWTALTTTGTPTFTATGNTSLKFVASQSGWRPNTVNGVYAYWIRIRVATVTSWTSSSVHGTRYIQRAKSQWGPTIVGNVRNSATYNDWSEHWAIGNLNGLYGYAADTYGVGLGKYANNESFLLADATDGIRIMRRASDTDTQLAKWATDGTITIGQVAASQDNIYISAGAISIRNNTTERIGMTAAGVLTIKDSGGNAVFTFDGSLGAEFTKPLTLATTGGIYQGTGTFASPTTGLKIWNDTGIGRIGGYNAGTLQWYVGTDGKLYAGNGAVTLDYNGISLTEGSSSANMVRWMSGSTELGRINTFLQSTNVNLQLYVVGATADLLLSSENNSDDSAHIALLSDVSAGVPEVNFSIEVDVSVNKVMFIQHHKVIVGDSAGFGVGDGSYSPGYGDIYVKKDIRLEGGLYIGSTATDPAAGNLYLTKTSSGYLQVDPYSSAMLIYGWHPSASGSALMDFEIFPYAGSDACTIRMFRQTNTSGGAQLAIYKGDNTATTQHYLKGDGDSYLAGDSGGVMIGSNGTPDTKLHINGAITLTEMSAHPTEPTTSDRCRVYMKGDMFIIMYDDGASTKYRYLTLNSTNATWTYTTTAP